MYETEPKLIWWNGEVVPWQDAQVHVASETALRGLNVFEGIRGYWRPETGQFAVIRPHEHLHRLAASARLLQIPHDGLIEQLAQGLGEILHATELREDVYVRPTIYVDSGRYTARQDTVTVGAFIACHPTGPRSDQPLSCTISTWRRIPELALPPLAKTGAAYTAFRLARLEALQAGADEAILLNADGHVTETPGAAVFLLRDGQLITPPLADGILDSITRRTVIRLAQTELGLTAQERSITRSELYSADEVFIAGTLDEVRLVGQIDRHAPRHRQAPVANALRTAYLELCTGSRQPLDATLVKLLP
ncbi:branched-chain amino acid transaminase [Kitasatospora paracochleata]|uniref:Branched-chain amino acid aminotransferase n=1 Tax=Kitasatospora paracochleata TaxID=58354 RepID=A0ABT1J8Y3_9ACTN|nr:aminotransferase class IV [Kitasatospora paracochleata]MCP2313905.1 branched-chain amino acid aminotransferase [Kitasatospora paracochleata]